MERTRVRPSETKCKGIVRQRVGPSEDQSQGLVRTSQVPVRQIARAQCGKEAIVMQRVRFQ